MTKNRDLKKLIRDRQHKTGESYTTARVHVLREQTEMIGPPPAVPEPLVDTAAPTRPERTEAAVLKINQQSARVRLLAGKREQLTFRSGDVHEVVPGQIVTLAIEKRWTWHNDEYASGTIESARIDAPALGLEPLPLEGGELMDLRGIYEHYRRPDPYAPLWRKLTAKPRVAFEMDPITWGAFPDADSDENPTGEASELFNAGDEDGARELLMALTLRDLRCLDAHAHLGNMAFERSPKTALLHYEIGIKIGELSLPAAFDGVLVWAALYNRPFLRCLHGFGLCLWRLGRALEAQHVFERMLSLNPNDNQGVRFCRDDVIHGRPWEEMAKREDEEEGRALVRARRRG